MHPAKNVRIIALGVLSADVRTIFFPETGMV